MHSGKLAFEGLFLSAVFFLSGCLCLEWSHQMVLDKDGTFVVHWSVQNDTIHFQVEVQTRGYVGFGFSKTGAMSGSDILTAWIHDGQIYYQDRYAIGNVVPLRDAAVNDWQMIGGSENATHTVLTFSRKLQTCDSQDIGIDESTIRLIYAYSDVDPGSNADSDDLKYHDLDRGSRSVMLIQPKLREFVPTENMLYWDVLSPNFTLTSENTSIYWCTIYKSPELSAKHHITKMEPLITAGHEGYVHHLVLYECITEDPEELEVLLDTGGHECRAPNMPKAAENCWAVIAAWGVGGNAIVFPDNVGFPLYESPSKYYSLEVHYDNPLRHGDLTDASGFRFHYTPHVRQYDAGTWMVGSNANPRVVIPPRQENFTIVGHANPKCFEPFMRPEGVKLMGTFLHAHLLGRHLKARHFRQNKELRPLGNNENFDFNYQEYVLYPEEVEFLPGDQISVECTYNSLARSSVTFGGYTTNEEMCLAFVLYYPLIERAVSVSGPALFDVLTNSGMNSSAKDFTSAVEVLKELDWSKMDIKDFESRMRYSPHKSFCFTGNKHSPWDLDVISYPENYQPYTTDSKGCISRNNDNTEAVTSFAMPRCPHILIVILTLQFGFYCK